MSDIFDILQARHVEVEHLFDRLQSSDDAGDRVALFFRLVDNLAMQASIEETQIFPLVAVPALAPLIDAARRAHAGIRVSLSDLLAIDPRDDGDEFDALLYLLRREVAAHVLDEECVLFPALRDVLAETDRRALAVSAGPWLDAPRLAA